MSDFDETEEYRRARQAELNAPRHGASTLEREYGQVWTTDELSRDFEVIGFLAPFVIVRRKADGAKGALEFQHSPRFYFNWQEHR